MALRKQLGRGVLVLLGLLMLAALPASAQTTLRITRIIEPPGAYTPGQTIDVRVNFIRQGGNAPVTQLGLVETIPSGWTFQGLVSGSTPQIPPAVGASGTLNFGWINIPTVFPSTFTYRLRAGNASSGARPVSGRAVYAVSGGLTQFSASVVTLVSQAEGTVPGEGEVTEGEGEGAEAAVIELGRAVDGVGNYVPGESVDITVTLTNESGGTVSQLGLIENTPPGWTFERLVRGNLPSIQPSTGRTGQLGFGWIFIPPFPASFTYRLKSDPASTGNQLATGNVIYSSGGAQQVGPSVETTIPEGTATEEGEGGTDGEFEGEPDPDVEVILSRVSNSNGFYTPGQPVELTVTLNYTGAEPVQQLGVEELVPNGWVFGGFSGGNPPPIAPQPGDGGTLGFAYISVPTFPVSFSYLLSVGSGTLGEQTVLGQGLYAFTDTQKRTRIAATTLQSTFEGETSPGLTMRRIPDDTVYTPGDVLEVTVNLTYVGTDNLTTLGFEEVIPAGWSFAGMTGDTPPPVVPAEGETGPLAFAWITPPTLPVAVTYLLNVDEATQGDQEIRGVARYRTADEEQLSNEEVTALTEPQVAEGEGEGDLGEGEGEGGAEGETDETITLERFILTGDGYAPGDIVDVRITVTQNEAVTLLAFGIEETLPEGFSFVSSLDSTPPPIRPNAGDRGVINFAYIIPPGLPINISYRLQADADTSGPKAISGKAQYRLSGPPLESSVVTTNLPELTPSDLIVCDVDLPEVIYSTRNFPLLVTLLNQGESGINPSWNDCVYLSEDNVFGDDELLFCLDNTSRMQPRTQYYLQERLDSPAVAPGNYFIFVRTDDSNAVAESDETNNVSQPIPVSIQTIDYDVQANHRIAVNEEGQGVILLRGTASNFLFGSPAINKPVLVDLTLRGVTRTFEATTNNFGAFEFPFTPLPTEAGRYSISGRHPGESIAPEQDSLNLNLMRIGYDGTIVSLAPNVSQTVSATVENLGDAVLGSVFASVLDVPEGITAQATVASSIEPGGTVPLTITLVVADAEGASGVMRVEVTNAQNVNSTLFLPFQVLDGVPNFTITPSEPLAGAIPGEQTLYVFEVSNIGGGTATNFGVVPPELPWITVVAPAIPSNLRAQQTARVILQLTPPSSQALGTINAPMFLSFGEDALVPIDLTVNVANSTVGGLDVTVTDETTLTTNPDFRVNGARVLLRNPATGAIVSERASTTTGEIQFRDIPEGVYDVEARRSGYGAFYGVAIVDPASINAYPIVMQRNFTQQQWRVEPTLADNAPNFISDTTVASGSPGPQITVEPAVIDLENMFENERTVMLTVRNDGSEPARNVRLTVADQTNFDFTPLVTTLGDLTAGQSLEIPVLARRIAPVASAAFDCEIARSSGVSFIWLRGNTPVRRAFPLALRLPRVDCPESRPAYGYLPLEQDGAFPYTPQPLFVQAPPAVTANKKAAPAEAASALTPPLPRSAPEAEDEGLLSTVGKALWNLLPGFGLGAFFADDTATVMRQDFSAVAPAAIETGLVPLLRWEGITPSRPDASLTPDEPRAAFVQATLRSSTGRTRVNEAFDIEVDLSTLADATLTNVGLDLRFFDELDLNETPAFQLTETRLVSINNISGTGVLTPGVSANARLRYVPLFRAARTRSKLYRIEPTLSYTRSGTVESVKLLPFNLLVDIQRSTAVQIYTPSELFGDDPLTPEIEPAQAFDIGVVVLNNSTDTLRDVRVNRLEPLLEEIDTGNINRFQALRLLDNQVSSRPGLNASLGSVAVSQRAGAVLQLNSLSSGNLVGLSNLLSREVPGLGRRTLLPDSTEQRTIIRAVQLNIGGDDLRPDLLIDTTTPPDGLPDSVVMSNTNPVAVQLGSNVQVTPSSTIPNAFNVTATMPFFVGYLQIPLPPGADPNLDRVLKSNNTPLLPQNVWATNRAVRQQDGSVLQQLVVNLVDTTSNGQYTVIMGAGLVVNEAPVADAGGDLSIFSGQNVSLEGRGSFDPEGDPLTYLWEFTERPSGSTATITNPTSATPSINPDRRGTYRIRLTVSDGNKSSTDTVSVSIANRGPTARTTGDLQAPTGSTVTLDATNSTDPEGDTLAFNWSVLSQPSGSNVSLTQANTATPQVTVQAAGNYVFRVVATDNFGANSSAEQRLTVVNRAPIANAGPDRTARTGDTISLDGSSSIDPDGSPLTYSWTFVSTPTGSRAIIQTANRDRASFGVDRQGDYVVRLTVSDGIASAVDEVNISTSNRTPIADAGAPQSGQVGSRVTLSGADSFDPDGDTLRFTWALIERPNGSSASLDSVSSVTPSFLLDVAGNYTARLVVSDGSLSSAPVTTTVSTNNTPPVANAGQDQSARVGDVITLNGSASTDADGDQLLYIWSFRAKAAGSISSLNNPNAVAPRFTVDEPGTYILELRVSDGRANSAADTVTISTENTAPVANAGPDRSARLGDTVNLDGAASTDADGDSLTYAWTLTSRPAGSASALSGADTRTPSFTIDEQGQYVARLIVNDGNVSSAPDTIVINTENSPPVANAGPDQSARVGQQVQLNGSGSQDPDGDTLTYQWRFTSVPEGSATGIGGASTISPFFVLDEPGTYVVSLTVNDGTVDSAPDTVIITTENTAPVANAGPDRSAALNQTLTLDGSASSDADGDTLTFAWSVVSRPTGSTAQLQNATQPQPSITIDEAGEYVVQLIVNDGTASSAPDTMRISTSNTPPIADAGNDRSALLGQTITLDGSGSADPDDDPLTYRWSLVSRPTGSAAALSSTTLQNPTITIDLAGDYVLQLIVNDGLVDSAPDTVRISTENTIPIARPGANRSVEIGTLVTLDGATSSDPDGDTLTFAWSFTSRPAGSAAALANATTVRATFTPDVAGAYVVRLVVNDGSLASAPVSVTITATQPDVVEPCEAPAAPTGVTASDGLFAERVEIQWNAVNGAVAYRVWRASTEDLASATPLSGWITGTTFSDSTADAPIVPAASGCQCQAAEPAFQFYFYWVQARSAAETACESGRAGPDRGHRGTAAKSLGVDESVRVRALPYEAASETLRKAAPNSSLYLRMTAPWGEVDSFWGEVSDGSFTSDAVTWLPVPGAEAYDGWVVYTPDNHWLPGATVTFTAGGTSTSGAVLGPYSMDFVIGDTMESTDAQMLPVSDDAEAGYALLPSSAYETPRRIALPVPAGLSPADAALYFHYDDGMGGVWRAAENISGWLAGAPEITVIDGETHIVAKVTHGGIVRVGTRQITEQARASAIPDPAHWGDLLAGGLLIALLVGLSSRKRCATT